jgi:hypothetical protein
MSIPGGGPGRAPAEAWLVTVGRQQLRVRRDPVAGGAAAVPAAYDADLGLLDLRRYLDWAPCRR